MNTTADLRKRNMLEILRVVRGNPMISRPEIAKKANLTSVTVSTLMSELLKRNIVVEQGEADSTGGRKALVYSINENSKYIIGVNIQIEMISVDLFNLSGLRVHKGARIKTQKDQTAEDTIYLMTSEIKSLLQQTENVGRKILGVGVTLPGVVDYKTGIAHKIANLGKWIDVPLKERFEDELHLPVYVESDTNSHLAYLKWADVADINGNVSYVMIGDGIGGAVMIDGTIYHGEHGLAGEVGHITLDIDGPACSCGNKGCFEVLASNSAIIRYYAEELKKSGKAADEVSAILGIRSAENDMILELARRVETEREADLAFSRASRYILACLSNMINTFDSSLLIIECRWMREARKYLNNIISGVFEINKLIRRNGVKIVLNPVEDIQRVSTAVVVIDKLFSDLDDNALLD